MRSFRLRGAVLAFIAASSWPLQIFASNFYDLGRPERVVGLIALMWVGGMVLTWVVNSFGTNLEAAENASFVTLVFVMNGGPTLREFGGLAYMILIGGPILAGWLSMRLKGNFVLAALIWGTAVALAVGPIVSFVDSWSSREGRSAVAGVEPMAFDLVEKPDIFLVVFDGYPGVIAAEQDRLNPGQIEAVSELRDRGFQVPESSWSSYWMTKLSIPSLMNMNYPVVDRSGIDGKTSQDLREIIAGENALVDLLKINGYTTHMVESGWSMASCGPAIDQCVPSPLLDETTYLILRHSVAWPLIDDSPGPWTLGTLAAFEWLLDESPKLSASSSPDFLFMHVMAPHPPFLLEPDCSVELIYERMGTYFNQADVSNETRVQFLIDQMDCVDRLMLELADSIDRDDILIFVSDHGTDRRYQTNSDDVDWDHETTVERLNNFLAVRLPSGCSIGDEVIVPNVLRLMMDCLSSSTVELLPERMWVRPMVELETDVVEELSSMGLESD